MTARIILLSLLGLSIFRGLLQAADCQNAEIDCHRLSKFVAEAYWTEKRMKAAKPTPLWPRELSGETVPSGSPSVSPSGSGWGVPAPADVAVWPYSAGGRLFFTSPQGDSWCSAELTGSNRVLLTAAHCVRDWKTGDWNSHFLFVRAYDHAAGRPHGQPVRLKSVCTWRGYLGEWTSNLALDYSFFTTETAVRGDWVSLGTSALYDSWTAIGYPGNYGDGQVMYSVAGIKGKAGKAEEGTVEMLGNPMESGASGGAWIHVRRTPFQGRGFVVGLNAAYGENETMLSPLFDAKTEELLRHVELCPVGQRRILPQARR